MARPSTDQRHAEIHAKALKQFDECLEACRKEREQCLEDRRFVSVPGAQWEGELSEQFENKPQFEVNKIAMSVMRIDNEYRNNRIDIDFVTEDGSDANGLDDTTAQLYRADVSKPCAQEAHDVAFFDAVTGGMGAWRLRCDYEDRNDDEHDYQRIYIESIFDPESTVYLLNARRRDQTDADAGFILNPLSPDQYRERYKEEPVSWDKSFYGVDFDWITRDVIYVAEYYVAEEKKKTVHVYLGIDGEETRYTDDEFERDMSLPGFLAAIGSKKVREKKITCRKIHKYELSGSHVLKDCGYIPGEYIPIVICYGRRTVINNVERVMGQVRLAKDSQRLINMLTSRLAEISAMSPYDKPIVLDEQIEGYQDEWASDNIKNNPVLRLKALYDQGGALLPLQGPVGYTKSPQIPPATAGLLGAAQTDLNDILGNQQDAEKMLSNIGEKTQAAIKSAIDMKAFGYLDNMRIAREIEATIWLSMAKEVYVENGRKMRGLTYQGDATQVELMEPELLESGEIVHRGDMKRANFRAIGTAGPSSQTRREKVFETITNLLALPNIDPQTAQVLLYTALTNLEGEGMDDVRDYSRRQLVQMGAVKPTDEERTELEQQAQMAAQQPPSPQDQALAAMSEQALGEAAAARASTVLKLSQAQKAQADAQKTLSEVGVSQRKQATDSLTSVAKLVKEQQPQYTMEPV